MVTMSANVELYSGKAEDFQPGRHFDEGWIYNCLQHVDDPNKVMATLLRSVDNVRIFEWIDTAPSEGHPHTLTPDHFERWLPGDKWFCLFWNVGEVRFDSNLATGRYIAIHATRVNT